MRGLDGYAPGGLAAITPWLREALPPDWIDASIDPVGTRGKTFRVVHESSVLAARLIEAGSKVSEVTRRIATAGMTPAIIYMKSSPTLGSNFTGVMLQSWLPDWLPISDFGCPGEKDTPWNMNTTKLLKKLGHLTAQLHAQLTRLLRPSYWANTSIGSVAVFAESLRDVKGAAGLECGALVNDTIAAIIGAMARTASTPTAARRLVVTHGDFHPRNILRNGANGSAMAM